LRERERERKGDGGERKEKRRESTLEEERADKSETKDGDGP
jgi:hypothetical protein